MELSVSDWGQIIDGMLTITAVLLPGFAIYASGLKKAKDQLVDVINQAPISNQQIFKIAEASGKKQAAKAIKILT